MGLVLCSKLCANDERLEFSVLPFFLDFVGAGVTFKDFLDVLIGTLRFFGLSRYGYFETDVFRAKWGMKPPRLDTGVCDKFYCVNQEL